MKEVTRLTDMLDAAYLAVHVTASGESLPQGLCESLCHTSSEFVSIMADGVTPLWVHAFVLGA